MESTPLSYAARFTCIGPQCEDTCCSSWDIPLNKEEYLRYSSSGSKQLRAMASQFISVAALTASQQTYASIKRRQSGSCGFYTEDRLCAIQSECGERRMPTPCKTYPRVLNSVGDAIEAGLYLSCPEAARQVLFTEDLLTQHKQVQYDFLDRKNIVALTDSLPGSPARPFHAFFAIREVVLRVVRDRSHPLWRRLLTIGLFCESLDKYPLQPHDKAQLGQLEELANNRFLALEPDKLSQQTSLRLDTFFLLTVARVEDPITPARFQDVFWSFIEGVGSADPSRPTEDLTRFSSAERRYYRPFMERNPFVLENYLVNYIIQNMFPFGRTDMLRPEFTGFFNEFVVMATQFAWIETLLIGVAGRYQEQFSAEHVVTVVQSFCRAIEHDHDVLASMLDFVVGKGMNTMEGMAALIIGSETLEQA